MKTRSPLLFIRTARLGIAMLVGCAVGAPLLAQTSAATQVPAPAPAQASPVATKPSPPFRPLNSEPGRSTGAKGIGPAAQSTEAADGKLPVPSTIGEDYKIAPNDLLEVEVFGVKELKREVRVNSSGYIALPLIGQLQVGGYTASDAEALVAIKYGEKFLRDPQISIFIKEFTTQRITVDGAVTKPGIFPLVGQITLLRALALAGGGAPMADLEEVMLFRLTPEGQSHVEKHNVMKIRKGLNKDPMLQGDDVIVVNRDSTRTALRDSLFRDILDAINPFSQSVGTMAR